MAGDGITLLGMLYLLLATWALAYSVARLEGPFGLLEKLRGAIDPDQRTWAGRGIRCPLCVAFWAAPAVLALAAVWPVAVQALGIWGGAMALHLLLDREG